MKLGLTWQFRANRGGSTKSHTRHSMISFVFCLSILMGLSLINTGIGNADSLGQLKDQLDQLQKKIYELEAQQADSSKKLEEMESKTVTAGEKKGSWVIPGSNTEVSIGGYLKIDAIYSDKSAGANQQGDQFFYPGAIPMDDSYEEDQINFHARQTRLVISTKTPTENWGDITAYFEGDFFGSDGTQTASNSNNLRTRHAYGRIGNLLAGQYWSTFMLVEFTPETLDFGGPPGSTFVRQSQLRWIQPFSWGTLQFALENPETTIVGTPNPDDDAFPDTIVRASFKNDLGKMDIAAMVRQLRIDTPTQDDDLWVGAVSLALNIPTVGKDNICFQINYGNGLGRYLGGNFQDAMINPTTGDLESYTQLAGFIYYRHFWTDTLRSTAVYSYMTADNDTKYVPTTADDTFQSAHANLIYSPVPKVDIGLEYIWANRELENGKDADLNRVQASVIYRFF